MTTVGIVFVVLSGLLLLACVLVVANAVRRSRVGGANVEQRGWRRLPDDDPVLEEWAGRVGWPFLRALEPGRASDVVTGEVDGVEFLSLRWSQSEPARGKTPSEIERYNIVAVRCEVDLPHLSVVRGAHRVRPDRQVAGAEEVEVGEDRFDRRWQVLGDEALARELLTPEVRRVLDDLGGAWVLQPGWATRVVKWAFYSGEDAMVEELRRLAAPWRAVPAESWRRWGGVPALVTRLGAPGSDASSPDGPGRGWE